MLLRSNDRLGNGFTLIEILVVLVILGIAMGIGIPLLSSAGTVQVQSAADMITADIEYARSMSISRQGNYGVLFDTGAEKYTVVDPNVNVIKNPVTGSDYKVDFKTNGLNEVDLNQANFDGTSTLKFDYLGSPLNGSNTPLSAGTIKVIGGGITYTISVAPITGYITVK